MAAAIARQAIPRFSAATTSPPPRRAAQPGSTIGSRPARWVGFAVAGGGTSGGLAQGRGGGKSDAFQAGLYGTAPSGSAYLAAALAYTNHWMSTDRFAFAGDHLSASFNAQSFGGRVESGYRIATFYGGPPPSPPLPPHNSPTPPHTPPPPPTPPLLT